MPAAPRLVDSLFNGLEVGRSVALSGGLSKGDQKIMTRSFISKSGLAGSLAVAAAIFVFSNTAMAQVEHPSQITFQGTALVTKDSTAGTNENRATKSGGLLLGYSYQFNSWAGAEGNYGFTRNTQNYTGSLGLSSVEADIHEFTGAFVAHIPVRVSKVRPYGLAGAGALVFDPTDKFLLNGTERQTKATFVYGGGVNFDVTSNFGVRAEYRGLLYKVPDFSLGTLNLDKVTHLAQPSVGFFVLF
jgi:opacity protein-like surface antigen